MSINEGTCYVFYAFDVGLSVDLDRAAELLGGSGEKKRFRRTQKSPEYFDYDPQPIRVSQHCVPILFMSGTGAGEVLSDELPEQFRTGDSVEITLFDFGGISVSYKIDISGNLSELTNLSDELYENSRLLSDALHRVRSLLEQIEIAVERGCSPGLFESYVFFDIRRLTPDTFAEDVSVQDFLEQHAQVLGQILRCDKQELSSSEVSEALSARLSYTPVDLVIIDWNVAVCLRGDSDDIRAVLEFANIELLEMRLLDKQLDDALNSSYRTLTSRGEQHSNLAKVAQYQVDAAVMFEAVNNALKLLGDQYLARVYSLVSKRFHLADWDASILRKIDTLDSIYQKISDRKTTFKMEVLEAIIIFLFIFEIVVSFVRK